MYGISKAEHTRANNQMGSAPQTARPTLAQMHPLQARTAAFTFRLQTSSANQTVETMQLSQETAKLSCKRKTAWKSINA